MKVLRYTAQEREDTAIETCNATKFRTISPGLCSSCDDCHSAFGMTATEFHHAMESREIADEGGFSWQSCEVCGSALGGDRYAAHGCADDGSTMHYDICTDCVQYLANGEPYPDEEYGKARL